MSQYGGLAGKQIQSFFVVVGDLQKARRVAHTLNMIQVPLYLLAGKRKCVCLCVWGYLNF